MGAFKALLIIIIIFVSMIGVGVYFIDQQEERLQNDILILDDIFTCSDDFDCIVAYGNAGLSKSSLKLIEEGKIIPECNPQKICDAKIDPIFFCEEFGCSEVIID